MNRRIEHWNISKLSKLMTCLLIAVVSCMVVPLYFSPASETLGTVPVERLFLYAILFCIAFLVVGEMTGFFESENQTSLLKSPRSSIKNLRGLIPLAIGYTWRDASHTS